MGSIVLFVSPNVQDAGTLVRILDKASVAVVHALGLKEAVARMKAGWFPVVLTEAKLDDGTWRDLLPLARRHRSELVVTDAFADAQSWAEAINLGAFDMLVQPFHETEVRRVLASASGNAGVKVATA